VLRQREHGAKVVCVVLYWSVVLDWKSCCVVGVESVAEESMLGIGIGGSCW
jgi:hypothetical protein